MKTQIISLESHDDLISIRDRISWVKTPRVLLVWPKYARLVLRSVDLKILQRHAAAQGAQLGLVTRKWNVIRDAELLEIPVFESTGSAQREQWPERNLQPDRQTRRLEMIGKRSKSAHNKLREAGRASRVEDAKWKNLPLVRAIAFSVGVLSVLAIVSLFIPRASVVIYPQSQPQSVMIPISADPSIDAVILPSIVPAFEKTLIVEQIQSLTITSQIAIPQKKAQGIVRFSNLTQQEIFLPKGTVVYTLGDSSVRFATLNETRVKAGLKEIAEVPVEAVEPGAAGNLPADSIKVVEGAFGLSLLVTNIDPFAGGSDKTSVGATVEDRERLRAMLMDQLAFSALQSFDANNVTEDIILLPDTLLIAKILEESYTPLAGQAGTPLTLSLRVEFKVHYVNAKDLQTVSRIIMDPALPIGFVPASQRADLVLVGEPITAENGITTMNVQAQRILLKEIDPNQVFNLIRGHTPTTAAELLSQNFSMRQPALITVTPSWWGLLPVLPLRLSVDIQ